MLTICLAQELKQLKICVVALHPGKLKTGLAAADADMEARDAAKNIFTLIEDLDQSHSGKFLQPLTEELDW